jgi:hypothetical protein
MRPNPLIKETVMDTPNIETIRTMPKEDLAALNKQLTKNLARHMVGMLFVKLTLTSVVSVLARKALIEAAKRA